MAESWASAEYCIHSTGQFGGVHAFGYYSAESEQIWMKSGALGVHCWGLWRSQREDLGVQTPIKMSKKFRG